VKDNPRVFVSYSHENEVFENKILDFSNKLRSEGIDANVDLYEEAPAEGWPKWMDNQIREADFVVVVITKSYFDKCYGQNTKGKGVSWEVNIVYQYIYDNYSENNKFIPVFFDTEAEEYILTPLKPFTFYNVGDEAGFDRLYWRLRGVTKIQKPAIGKLRPLPTKEKRTMFFSSPINLELWNDASWEGVLYLFFPNEKPVIGILYKNYETGKKIFTDWKKRSNGDYIDDFVDVVYIEPPFPDKCFIYNDVERNNGKGYFVHIGPNIDKSINRMQDYGLNLYDGILATVSRYQWMDEINGTKNRDFFKQLAKSYGEFMIMPVARKDRKKNISEDNLLIDFSYAVCSHKIKFVRGIDVKEEDNYKVVLEKPSNDIGLH